MCERRRRERRFWYILRETRILMPVVVKDGGHGGPHLQKVGGQSKQMGAIGPLAPAYFHHWSQRTFSKCCNFGVYCKISLNYMHLVIGTNRCRNLYIFMSKIYTWC